LGGSLFFVLQIIHVAVFLITAANEAKGDSLLTCRWGSRLGRLISTGMLSS